MGSEMCIRDRCGDSPGQADHPGCYANPREGVPSFMFYQRISKRHTYIMSKTEPSSASLVIEKALKKSKAGIMMNIENIHRLMFFPLLSLCILISLSFMKTHIQ